MVTHSSIYSWCHQWKREYFLWFLQTVKAAAERTSCLGSAAKKVPCWTTLFLIPSTQHNPPRAGLLMLCLLLKNYNFSPQYSDNEDFPFHMLIARIRIAADVSVAHLFHTSFYALLCPNAIPSPKLTNHLLSKELSLWPLYLQMFNHNGCTTESSFVSYKWTMGAPWNDHTYFRCAINIK